MTKPTEDNAATNRRGFLKLAAAAPAAAAVSLTADAAAADVLVPGKTTGLQNTEHVLTYYQTARF